MGVNVGVVHSRTLLVSGGGDPVSVRAWARCVCVWGFGGHRHGHVGIQ
jgi:hypothetical protein